MVVTLYDDISSFSPFEDLLRLIKKFVEVVDEKGELVNRAVALKNWTKRGHLPRFTGYEIEKANNEYKDIFKALRRRLRGKFAGYNLPTNELEQLLSMLEFREFPSPIETADEVFEAERYLDKQISQCVDLWDKLSAELDGKIEAHLTGELDMEGRPWDNYRVDVPPEYGPIYRGVYVDGAYQPLTRRQWMIFKLMSDKRAIGARTGKGELDDLGIQALTILKRLRAKDLENPSDTGAKWADVIEKAGVKGNGYTIL